jgi:acyl-CoA thioesterase-1
MLNRVGYLLLIHFFLLPLDLFAQSKGLVVVMLGDSTTASSGQKGGDRMTGATEIELKKRLEEGTQLTLVNGGVGGDTAAGGLRRFPALLKKHKPDLVSVSFGLNDTGRLTPEVYEQSIEGIVLLLKKQGVKVLLVTSTPFNNERHGWGKLGKYAATGLDEYMDANICQRMRNIAKKHKVPLCDLHAHFREAIKRKPELIDTLLRRDGVHLTPEGNRLAASHLGPAMHEALKK